MASLRAPSLFFVACAAGACFLPDVDVSGTPCPCPSDGYRCNEQTMTCERTSGSSATSNAGGSTSSQSVTTGSMTTTTTTSSSGTGGGPPLSMPLVVDSDIPTGTLSLSVANAFRIQATPTRSWLWSKWIDLANGNTENLASTTPGVDSQNVDVLFDPMYLTDGTDWFDYASGSNTGVSLIDQTPARCIVGTDHAYAVGGLVLHTEFVVYATGKVAVSVAMTNTSASVVNLPYIEYNYVSVNPNLLPSGPGAWTKTSYNDRAAGFLRTDGPAPLSSLLVIDKTDDQPLREDSATSNWYWGDGGALSLDPGEAYYTFGELQLGPGDQSGSLHAARADDSLAPGLQVTSGGMFTGYDNQEALYVIQADPGATSVTFGPTANLTRFSPAFAVRGFDPTSWRVMHDGVEIVSSANLIGHGALAHDDGPGNVLIVFTGEVPMGASDAERFFTLEAM